MSIQFGRWNFDNKPVDARYLDKVRRLLRPYGPDGENSYENDNISISYHAFHTTNESHLETQPWLSACGSVITYDGRLDNRIELVSQLHDQVNSNSTDVAIVAAAYTAWGLRCLPRLIGDWALAIWTPHKRSVLLAKDPIGTRHLYYSIQSDHCCWCTVLEPLVRLAGKTFELDEQYIAGWFSMFPAAHLTPYMGISAVPPTSFVLIQNNQGSVRKYWDFDPTKRIRYRTDTEYAEHYRSLFGDAVRRRLRADRPILAELSGGRDSSAIVCMADRLISCGSIATQRLDTFSMYDDSDGRWNEKLYFTKIEEKRGRVGFHVDLGTSKSRHSKKSGEYHPNCPLAPRYTEALPEFGECLVSQGNRIVLSGIAGDEVMGGIPTPTPQLQSLFARARFRMLAHELRAWSLETRKPWLHLLFETLRGFLPPSLIGVPDKLRAMPWIRPNFVSRNWAALTGFPTRVRLFGPVASFQDSMSTLDYLRRQIACNPLTCDPPYEKRYPFLDRDLLEFMYAIPREQSVLPHQRRSLMRRAQRGIVPDEILDRKWKAPPARSCLLQIRREWANLGGSRHLVSSSLGIIDAERFFTAFQSEQKGVEVSILALVRTTLIEQWLRNVMASGVVRHHQEWL
jgi:asparagine synthase (glutamine-hydrolysing)